jgi:hypothetical protein
MFKKYFQFEGTINGTIFFLRNFLSGILCYIGGFMLGFGITSEINFMILLGIFFLFSGLFLGLTTIYKRLTALFVENITLYTSVFVGLQFLSEIFSEEYISIPLKILVVVLNLYLIFSNSKIKNHVG